jgi:signal transduction histidine kinase
MISRWGITGLRAAAAVALGAVTAVAELAFVVVVAGPALVFRRTRFIAAGALWLVHLERRRLRSLCGLADVGDGDDGGGRRAIAYLAARWPVGLLGGGVLFLLAYGALTAVAGVAGWLSGGRPDGIEPTVPVVAYLLAAGFVLLFLDLAGLGAVVLAERGIARRLLGPSDVELMRHRIVELSASRAGIVEAVDAERRRIERDLHDGLQQRLVALAMLLGRARRTGSAGRAADLYQQAHDEAQRAVEELREVAWRAYPTALDQLGLAEALAAVAERSPVPVRIHCVLPTRPAPRIETAAFFTVREAVTNAAKHSGALLIEVSITAHATMVIVRITDDGAGGADPGGRGLTGLARRVVALDGRFTVDSPPGGPTVIEAALPCG